MIKLIFLSILFSFSAALSFAQSEVKFGRIDSLLFFTERNSLSIKLNEQQSLLAKWQKISTVAGLINFRVQTNFNLTNNLELPVTFLPAEAFGGLPGTFKEVKTGQPFIGNFNFSPQIDIINPANWAKLRSANINQQLTEVNNSAAKKFLFESISANYHNILSLKEQIEITRESLVSADTIMLNMLEKYREGIVRQQDLNETQINRILISDKLEQLKVSIRQQYLSLKILCDIPDSVDISITERPDYNQNFPLRLETFSQLQYQSSLLKSDLAETDLLTNHLMQLPTVSLVYYDSWQQNSSDRFFDNNVKWLNSQYIGLRISLPLPDVNRFMQTRMSQISSKIAQQNAEHAKLQNELVNRQLVLEYEKAYSQLITAMKISELRKQNYNHSLNQFNQSVLSPDKLLLSFNELLSSRLNCSVSFSTLLYLKSKIEIDNQIK